MLSTMQSTILSVMLSATLSALLIASLNATLSAMLMREQIKNCKILSRHNVNSPKETRLNTLQSCNARKDFLKCDAHHLLSTYVAPAPRLL